MPMKNASREARLRAEFAEMRADSIRHSENSTPLYLQADPTTH
jgi:hypothetical protein